MVASAETEAVLPRGFTRERTVEPIGRWFLSKWERLNSTRTLSHGQGSDSSDDEDEDVDDEGIYEDDLEFLRSLDPKETKDQDHYRVLGLSKLRIEATDEQIKRAHRLKVLKHHPDKRRAAGEETKDDDDYFSCITKAFEILGNPSKRKSFDSVDPTFNDDIPDAMKKDSKEDFFSLFCPVFERNARWSIKTPVPLVGCDDSKRADVDTFYSFWYSFDSWREFSYLDEEDKEKAGDKWERREIDKINKAQRKEKKAEETKRIRKLVDNAYSSDPRIQRFRDEEKNEKLAKKKAKADQAKARRDEEERVRKEQEDKEREEREAQEELERARKEKEKKEKEAVKKQIKNERKKFRSIAKDNNFFTSDETEKVNNMAEVEKICEVYTLDQIKELVLQLDNNPATVNEIFAAVMKEFNEKLEEERLEAAQMTSRSSESGKSKVGRDWDTEELQLLIKSVNLFPAGTVNRWEVCAEFINQHSNNQRSAKEVLAKAKEMQSGNFALSSLKEEVNKLAYENLQRGQKKEVLERVNKESECSKRLDSPAELLGINNSPWSSDEQKLLEQALKTFPSSTPERWDRIAEAVPNRSKKDCMKRYKELAETIKAKKAALAKAAKKS